MWRTAICRPAAGGKIFAIENANAKQLSVQMDKMIISYKVWNMPRRWCNYLVHLQFGTTDKQIFSKMNV